MDTYVLKCTQDMRDRTAEIQEILRQQGCCLLEKGIYVVSGVIMPPGTTLAGAGKESILLLDPQMDSGCTVKMDSFCTVRNLTVAGSLEDLPLPSAVGERHGICFMGTATVEKPYGQPRNAVIHGCFAHDFSGGGLTFRDTGYSVICCTTVSDCHIWNCGAGINIDHFSEYHKFTNVVASHNLYGCINNGGNNNFIGCAFDSNVEGFLIDNSQGQSNNNSHGSVVGCTFNHSNKNKGVGIRLLGAMHGYVFTGCQMFFSSIVVENSSGIVFDTFNYGVNMDIRVVGGQLVMFTDSCFGNTPASICITDNAIVKFQNCWTRDGQPIGMEK